MKEKRTFSIIFALFALSLAILPFLVSFNDFLTRIVEENLLYVWLQTQIVPFEAKIIGAILLLFGYDYALALNASGVVVNGLYMGLTWNCLGWQSFLLFLITLLFGLRGRYTKFSILEALGIGILGTFWLNIFRMIFIISLAVHLQPVFRIIFHDYLAAITTVLWLFFFWWFSYSFVLEEKVRS